MFIVNKAMGAYRHHACLPNPESIYKTIGHYVICKGQMCFFLCGDNASFLIINLHPLTSNIYLKESILLVDNQYNLL